MSLMLLVWKKKQGTSPMDVACGKTLFFLHRRDTKKKESCGGVKDRFAYRKSVLQVCWNMIATLWSMCIDFAIEGMHYSWGHNRKWRHFASSRRHFASSRRRWALHLSSISPLTEKYVEMKGKLFLLRIRCYFSLHGQEKLRFDDRSRQEKNFSSLFLEQSVVVPIKEKEQIKQNSSIGEVHSYNFDRKWDHSVLSRRKPLHFSCGSPTKKPMKGKPGTQWNRLYGIVRNGLIFTELLQQ